MAKSDKQSTIPTPADEVNVLPQESEGRKKLRKIKHEQRVEAVELEPMLNIGEPMDFGSVILHVPALSVNQIIKALPMIAKIGDLEAEGGEAQLKAIDLMMNIILMAIERNYPGRYVVGEAREGKESLGDIIDLATLRPTFEKVLSKSNIEIKN